MRTQGLEGLGSYVLEGCKIKGTMPEGLRQALACRVGQVREVDFLLFYNFQNALGAPSGKDLD